MSDLVIRNLDEQTINRLRMRAKAAGRTLQSETKRILQQAAGRSLDESLRVAGHWRKTVGKQPTDSVTMIRQDRQR